MTSLGPASPHTIKYPPEYHKRKLNSTLSDDESDEIEPSQKRIKTQLIQESRINIYESPSIDIYESPSRSKLNVTLSKFNRSPSNEYSAIDAPDVILPSELVRRVTKRIV